MKAYKGFNKDLTCRGFRYEIGKEYETDKAKLCETGFHACENPLDCFGYYNPADSRYCEVELDGVDKKRDGDDSKVCGKHIRVEAEIGLSGLIKAGVKFILDKVDWKNAKESNTGNRSAATVEGKDSVAIVTGYDSKAKACLGSAIVVVERGEWNGETYPLIGIKSAIVDGDVIKADTYYTVKNGEFVEVKK